ncbi:MAG: response regulator [Myxococcota bacterium]
MRGPIYVFHTSEHERNALARDLAQAQLDVWTFDTAAALTAASQEHRPAVVLWDLDAGKVRGGIARLAARLGSPVIGVTSVRATLQSADTTLTLLLPFERWRVAPVVLRVLQTLPERASEVDVGSVFGSMRVVADTIRQRPTDFIDPHVLEPGARAPSAERAAVPPPLPEPPPLPLAAALGGTPERTEAAPAMGPLLWPGAESPGQTPPPINFPASRTAATAPVPRPAARIRALIADDDEVLQHILGYQLEAHAWSVTKTGDGDVALRMVKGGEVDVLLLDLNLPHRNGFEILEQMGPGSSAVRVLVMSEQVQEEKVVRAFELGAHDFVQKPFNPRVMVSRIERLLKAV